MDREIGPLARAINREIAQGDDAEFVEMRKGRTKKLAGNFRGGIRAQRLSELFFFRKRDFLGGTIHRRTGCEDESFDAARLCCLKQVQGAADVGIIIKLRLLNRWPNTGARGEMNNRIELFVSK